MTRKEITGVRDLTFSGWVRRKLPDSSTGFSASDLDFILWNWKSKKVMMLEIKTRNSKPRIGQKIMWQNLNKCHEEDIAKNARRIVRMRDGEIYSDHSIVHDRAVDGDSSKELL